MATSISCERGYDLDFVDDPIPDEYLCPICLLVLKEPQLTDCCGSHLCRACCDDVKKSGRGCPKCRETAFSVVLNKHHRRKTLELKVYCQHRSRGCTWVDSLSYLEEHLDKKCQNVEVECPYGCGESLQRASLEHHRAEACMKRTYTCPYCQVYEDSFEVVTEEHKDVCPSFPLLCPNRCNVGTIDRCCLDQHLALCPLQELDCALHHAGCSGKILHKDVEAHMRENVHTHFELLSKITQKLSLDLQQRDRQIQQNEEKIARVEHLICLMPVPPIDMTLANFELLKNNNCEWNSPSFYSHSGGYKMCLRVCTNSGDQQQGDFIAVFACVEKGEFDDELAWPLRGEIVIQMLNQEYASQEMAPGHYEHRVLLDLPRMYHRAIGVGYGMVEFFPLSSLITHMNEGVKCTFLKFDRLHFRVVSVSCPRYPSSHFDE